MLLVAPLPSRPAGGLAETYRWLAETCPSLQVRLVDHEPTGPQNWIPATRLAGSVEELIAGESDRIRQRHGTEPRAHVAASRLLHHYLWSAALLAAGPWYLDGRVPRLHAADLWIDPATGDLALRPGRWARGDETALRQTLAAHLGPVLAAFQPYVRRGPRALWGMAADDLASAIWHLGKALDQEDHAIAVATAVLPGDTPPFPGAAAFRPLPARSGRTHWTRTRAGCCLYYAIDPATPCITCPRTCDAERLRRLEA